MQFHTPCPKIVLTAESAQGQIARTPRTAIEQQLGTAGMTAPTAGFPLTICSLSSNMT